MSRKSDAVQKAHAKDRGFPGTLLCNSEEDSKRGSGCERGSKADIRNPCPLGCLFVEIDGQQNDQHFVCGKEQRNRPRTKCPETPQDLLLLQRSRCSYLGFALCWIWIQFHVASSNIGFEGCRGEKYQKNCSNGRRFNRPCLDVEGMVHLSSFLKLI